MKARFRIRVVIALAVAAVIGGGVYSRLWQRVSDAPVAQRDAPAPPTPTTKTSPPARPLNEKERLLVGRWTFENTDPKLYSPGYEATYEFTADGMFTFSFSSVYVKHWSQHGKYRVAGSIVITEPEVGETAVNQIEELTPTRFVISAPSGRDRSVQEWSRARRD